MNPKGSYIIRAYFLAVLLLAGSLAACQREPRTSAFYGSSTIEERYGLTGAYSDRIQTEDGTMDATIVPITLSDGRTGQLVIPKRQSAGHRVFLRDENGLSPVVLENPRMTRDEFVRSQPRVVERRAATTSAPVVKKKKRSWQREALIIGGSSGAGAAIGAVAGGKKGAAVGAISGGVAGLIYDLATRNK
jgi:hypothetical protein